MVERDIFRRGPCIRLHRCLLQTAADNLLSDRVSRPITLAGRLLRVSAQNLPLTARSDQTLSESQLATTVTSPIERSELYFG